MVSFLITVVMPGHSRLKDGVASVRLCAGHPRLLLCARIKTWMAGTSPAMTENIDNRARSAKTPLR